MKKNNNQYSMLQSVLVGAGFAGIISVIPLINLLNLFFMFWMAVGGAIGVYMLNRKTGPLSIRDTLLCGGFSGFFGGILFALITFVSISMINAESIAKMLSLISSFIPSIQEELADFDQSYDFHIMVLPIMLFSIIISTISGLAGGFLSRWLLSKKTDGAD